MTRLHPVAVAAAALGAKVIEKHFTLDKNAPGPDHKASLDLYELGRMINGIRDIEVALGTGVKCPTQSEKINMTVVRKSIVAACAIQRGELFTDQNLSTKRPGNGISPMEWDRCIGKPAPRDFSPDEQIDL